MYYELAHPERLHVKREDELFYGGDQEWYPGYIQRLSGCGPTVASELLIYDGAASFDGSYLSMLEAMKTSWKFVTPGARGIPTLKSFTEKFKKYASSHGARYEFMTLETGRAKYLKPTSPELFEFIAGGISRDRPVAFLNLDNGGADALESYHWVLITGVALDENGVKATIFDEGKKKNIDLSVWLGGTKRYGGFLYTLPASFDQGNKTAE